MRAAIRSAFRSGFRGAFRRAARVLNRYIRTWNGSTTSGALNDPINAVAGDTIEILFSNVVADGATRTMCDSDAVGADRFIVYSNTSDNISWSTGNISALTIDGIAATVNVTTYPADGKLHTIKATISAAANLGTIGANYLLALFGNDSILTITHTPIATGIPLVYDIDDDSLIYTQADGYSLGSESAPDPSLDDLPSWTFTDELEWDQSTSGQLSIASAADRNDATYGGSQYVTGLVIGETYVASIEYAGVSGDFRVYAKDQLNLPSGSGVFEYVFTAPDTQVFRIISPRTGASGTIKSFSIKSAQKSITWSNFVASDIELFTYDAANTLWQGVEMYTAGPAWAFDGTEPAFTSVTISPNTTTIGARYKQEFVISSYTSGTISNTLAGVFIGNNTGVGSDSSTVTAIQSASTGTRVQAAVVPCIASGTWSVKRVLEEV